MRRSIRLILPAMAIAATPALAEEPGVQPAVFQAILDCRAIADPAARLACYDASATALDSAARAREVLVVDRATASQTKRSLFGMAMPRVKLFGENDVEEVEQIDTTIVSTYSARDGAQVFVLADGARWKQTDGRNTFAKAGQPITIRKGSLGSFFARVNNQTGVRVIRIQQ